MQHHTLQLRIQLPASLSSVLLHLYLPADHRQTFLSVHSLQRCIYFRSMSYSEAIPDTVHTLLFRHEIVHCYYQIVRHLCGSIYRNIFKTNISTPVNHKMTCLSIIIITVTPHAYLCCPIADCGIYICIKKPEWNVNTFDFINMILILEDLWQKALMLPQIVPSL